LAYRILIVDDSDLIRRTLRSCIEQNADWCVCGEAANGEVAIDKVRELSPDVVILDFQMPVMNGLDAARRIASSAPNTAIVMLTIHSCSQLRNDAQAVGIKFVLSKSERVADHLLESLKELCA
jgi:DNA-binding NarL/FixJ family response regulator